MDKNELTIPLVFSFPFPIVDRRLIMGRNGQRSKPRGLRWRASTPFILVTVAMGLFTDLFLYGLCVPVLPFVLTSRVGVPPEQVQSTSSMLLAVYSASSLAISPVIGVAADKAKTRRGPYMVGLIALLGATVLLCFGRTLALLTLARVLQGMSGAIVWTLGLAILQDTVGSKDLGKTIASSLRSPFRPALILRPQGSIFSFISVGELLAPTLGGILNAHSYYSVYALGFGVLVVDVVLRLLVLEKSVLREWEEKPMFAREGEADERTPLVGEDERIDHSEEDLKDASKLVRAFPFLQLISSPRLLTAFLLAFTQATLLASYDSTIPLHSQRLFDFDSLGSGLLFVALDVPYLVLGPGMGWLVDKRGPRGVAVASTVFLIPALVLLRLPRRAADGDPARTGQIVLYAALLAINGIGMSAISAPSLVDASAVVEAASRRSPSKFGDKGPYGQLFSVYSATFSCGMTVGPGVVGVLSGKIGYGNAMAVVAGLCAVAGAMSWRFMGRKREDGEIVDP